MIPKYLVLVAHEDKWIIAVETAERNFAIDEIDSLKSRETPALLIYTGDFITV